MELRHQHIGAVSARLSALTEEFRAKNQAASSYRGGAGAGGAMDMRIMRSLVQSLPQYRYSLCGLPICCAAALGTCTKQMAPSRDAQAAFAGAVASVNSRWDSSQGCQIQQGTITHWGVDLTACAYDILCPAADSGQQAGNALEGIVLC